MTFSSSTSPDITESIPGQLSQRSTSLPNPSSKIRFDLDINNLHFLLKPSADSPYMRQSVPVQKQQQDTSKEPGEQSLEGYWIRSQNSWHKGAGISFYEPGAEPDTEYRFTESSGVDVWTQGQLTPLHKMGLTTTVATGKPYIQEYGPEGWVVTNDTAVVRGIPTGGATITIEAPPASANGRWYFFGTDKRVKVGSSAVADPGTGIWNAKTNTVIAKNATKMPQVWYLKDRLIATHGKDVYEVPLNVATPVDFGTTTGAAYVPTDTGLQWLDATDGPSAIFLGFTDGSRDGVVRFTLQDAGAGSTPKLSQAYRVLDLPQGERLYKMFGFLGRFLLLSTSMGIRVCAVDGQGSLTMGQVSVPAAKTGRLNCFHANGSFVYVGGADIPASGTSGGTSLPGWTTTTGFIRINLGEPIGNAEDLRFAWANDIRTGVNGNVTSSVYMGNGRSAIAVEGSGVWDMDAFNLEPVGYIAMGRVRYSTFVPKIFRSLDLAGAIPGGTALRAQILDESDVAEKLAPYLGLGYRHLIGGFPAPHDEESMTRFATEVRPLLERAG